MLWTKALIITNVFVLIGAALNIYNSINEIRSLMPLEIALAGTLVFAGAVSIDLYRARPASAQG